MSQTELAELGRRAAMGALTDNDATRLLAEVHRLRGWLEYAVENMTYPYVQVDLAEALSDRAPVFQRTG
jgi:hypothetical protein